METSVAIAIIMVCAAHAALTYITIRSLYWTMRQDHQLKKLGLLNRWEQERIARLRMQNGKQPGIIELP